MRCDAAASVLGRDAARAGEPETTLAPRRPSRSRRMRKARDPLDCLFY